MAIQDKLWELNKKTKEDIKTTKTCFNCYYGDNWGYECNGVCKLRTDGVKVAFIVYLRKNGLDFDKDLTPSDKAAFNRHKVYTWPEKLCDLWREKE